MSTVTPLSMAVVGAGPAGLALALNAARELPHAAITLFDVRELTQDVSADPRTLALSLGSVLELRRLGVWPAIEPQAAAIAQVHVSQQQPGLLSLIGQMGRSGATPREPEVLIRAVDEGLPQLGAVASYGAIVAPLQAAWRDAVAQAPQRLSSRFGTRVSEIKRTAQGVELDAGVAEGFDLAVVAEGGVFAEQRGKAVQRDYAQTAWVGQVDIEGGEAGTAYERFTPHGPAALLPLPSDGAARRAALVWCVPSDDDPVRALDDAARLAVLNHLFHPRVGRLVRISPLKSFGLGLNAERSLVLGRQVRIGNAAQTLHPVAGQGLNLGLRDAHELVRALRHAGDIDTALRRVDWQRAPDRWSMIAATDFLARSFTWPWPGLATLRGAALATLERAGPLKSMLARRMMFGGR